MSRSGIAHEVEITRKVRFCAAHHFKLPSVSEAEATARYGKSANPEGHGHNYELAIAVRGPINPATGMVMNLTDLKRLLHALVIDPLDFKNLNTQVPLFRAQLPCLENMACGLWPVLASRLDALAMRLQWIKIAEADDFWVMYAGRQSIEAPLMSAQPTSSDSKAACTPSPSAAGCDVRLTRRYEFCASHRLYNPAMNDAENRQTFGKCSNPNGHGHNYQLEVTVSGTPDPETGLLVDLMALDRCVDDTLLQAVDHKDFNRDVPFMAGQIPTTETIVVAFWQQLQARIPGPAKLYALRLQETRNNVAEYRGEHSNPEEAPCHE